MADALPAEMLEALLLARIHHFRRSAALSASDLEGLAELPAGRLTALELGHDELSAGEVWRIGRALGRSMDEMFARATPARSFQSTLTGKDA